MGLGIRGKEYIVQGQKITLYPIAKVSQMFTDAKIPRSTQTIQKWELAEVIPNTPYRKGGKRLYSLEWIQKLVAIAKKNKINLRCSLRSFSFEAWEELTKLKEEI